MTLDRIIHQPIRTPIVVRLANGAADYVALRDTLSLTDGHMATHMRALTGSGYVTFEKEFVGKRPRTTYKLSPLGRKRFGAYIKTLKEVIEG